MFYAIHATATVRTEHQFGQTTTVARQVPTFFLDSNVQGILDADHAATIAARLLGVGAADSSATFSVQAIPCPTIVNNT